jgi:ABC-type arginine/histidine transport system permease subunit
VNMQITYHFALGACGNEIVPSFKSTALVVGIMWGCVLPKKLVSPLEFD